MTKRRFHTTRPTIKRLVSFALLFTFALAQPSPVLAMRATQVGEDQSGSADQGESVLVQIGSKLRQLASAAGFPVPVAADYAQATAGLEGGYILQPIFQDARFSFQPFFTSGEREVGILYSDRLVLVDPNTGARREVTGFQRPNRALSLRNGARIIVGEEGGFSSITPTAELPRRVWTPVPGVQGFIPILELTDGRVLFEAVVRKTEDAAGQLAAIHPAVPTQVTWFDLSTPDHPETQGIYTHRLNAGALQLADGRLIVGRANLGGGEGRANDLAFLDPATGQVTPIPDSYNVYGLLAINHPEGYDVLAVKRRSLRLFNSQTGQWGRRIPAKGEGGGIFSDFGNPLVLPGGRMVVMPERDALAEVSLVTGEVRRVPGLRSPSSPVELVDGSILVAARIKPPPVGSKQEEVGSELVQISFQKGAALGDETKAILSRTPLGFHAGWLQPLSGAGGRVLVAGDGRLAVAQKAAGLEEVMRGTPAEIEVWLQGELTKRMATRGISIRGIRLLYPHAVPAEEERGVVGNVQDDRIVFPPGPVSDKFPAAIAAQVRSRLEMFEGEPGAAELQYRVTEALLEGVPWLQIQPLQTAGLEQGRGVSYVEMERTIREWYEQGLAKQLVAPPHSQPQPISDLVSQGRLSAVLYEAAQGGTRPLQMTAFSLTAGFLRVDVAEAGLEQERAGQLDVTQRFNRLYEELRQFREDHPQGLQPDPARAPSTGVLVDLTGAPVQAFVLPYLRLPEGSAVLADAQMVAKVKDADPAFPKGVTVYSTEGEGDYARGLRQAIGSFPAGTAVQIYSTRPEEQIRAAAGPLWERIRVVTAGTLQELLKNLGVSPKDEALAELMRIVDELEDDAELVEFL